MANKTLPQDSVIASESSRSLWMEQPALRFDRLEANVSADVVIIGSGIAGLSTAYELALGGANIIVIDRGLVARGITARTSAHLTSALDDFYHQMIPIRGIEIAQRHFASQAAAIDRIDAIRQTERIACDFKRLDAYLFLAGDVQLNALEQEMSALEEVGLKGSRIDMAPSAKHTLSDGPCLVIPQQGRFHPLKYLNGLARACAGLGVRLFEQTCALTVEETQTGVRVTTLNHCVIDANAAVVATNSPIIGKEVHAKQMPYRTYVLAAKIRARSVRDVLYWDTEEPYHYVRLHPTKGGELLLVGGEDHKTGAADDANVRFRRLERWARRRFPEMGEIVHRWSGQVMDTMDYAAFIGLNPSSKRTFVATGDSGQGITHGVAASLMLPALLAGKPHPWADVFAPQRKRRGALGSAVNSGLSLVKNFADTISPGQIAKETRLRRGKGGIKRSGLHLLAVCRDVNGVIHRHAAACSHAGCVVHWNSFEQCWDCPCHGSHFAPDGTATNAPAIKALPRAPAINEDSR